MYLHLGQSTVVRSETVVGIFDLEKTTISRTTRAYLAAATAADEVINVTMELPKSFVVTEENGKRTVYISQISPYTLQKRAGFLRAESRKLRKMATQNERTEEEEEKRMIKRLGLWPPFHQKKKKND